jgi:hypothetical protein
MKSKKRSPSDDRSERLTTAGLESGTDELKARHRVEWERLDLKGLFRRARVVDQCEIDRLFLSKEISASQYEAGQEYLASLFKAGSFIKSPSFEASIGGSVKDVEKRISLRIMAASAARSALSRSGIEATRLVDLTVGLNRKVRSRELRVLRRGLDCLARFYGTESVADPRRIF